MTAPPARSLGRPSATDRIAIERAAFRLFEEQGFDDTTMAQIAEAVGVGRRTLFRYYPSKNDIPWGQFAESLDSFRQILAATPAGVPLWESIHRGVLAFNDFPPEVMPVHRQRMRLILRTPALQAHSVHQYTEWRQVIADHVADRRDLAPDALLPRVVGRVSLALAMSAYEQWLESSSEPLLDILDEALSALREHLAEDRPPA